MLFLKLTPQFFSTLNLYLNLNFKIPVMYVHHVHNRLSVTLAIKKGAIYFLIY
jgi:hypothetical protein